MNERDSSIAIVAEPYRIPEGNPNWSGSSDGLVAIVTRRTKAPIPCQVVKQGQGFVTVKWKKTLIVGIYLSPKLTIREVEERFDKINRNIRAQEPSPLIIGGDFNAASEVWGARKSNARGKLILDWMATMDLECLNEGRESTCIRPQGESIVDLAAGKLQ